MTQDVDVTLGSGQMFDRIAPRYDLLNRLMSLGMDRYWRWRLIRSLNLPVDGQVLDVATGTGDVALHIQRKYPQVQVTGLDPSTGMLAVAQEKATRVQAGITWTEGDAQALPFGDGQFDAACIAFGIRNVPDRLLGLREMFRVVKPGGRVCVLELGEPSQGLLSAPARMYIHHVVPRLGAWLSGAQEYAYLQESIAAFPDAQTFAGVMREAGAREVTVKPLAFGACNLYVGEG